MDDGVGLLAAGAVLGIFGALVRFGGMVELVARYDPERVEDDEALARFVGSNVLAMTALTVLVGALEYAGVVDGVDWPGGRTSWACSRSRRGRSAGRAGSNAPQTPYLLGSELTSIIEFMFVRGAASSR
jgi:hypothetical protein